MNAEHEYGFPIDKAAVRIPIISEKLDVKLGLRTKNPFTQTPAKRIASMVGLCLSYGKYRIREHYVHIKQSAWEKRADEAMLKAERKGRLYSEVLELINSGDEQRIRNVVEPALEAVLNASDASQEEVDWLVGITSKDPTPLHRINFEAGNAEEGRIVAVFPGSSPLRFRQETTGEAEQRTTKEEREALLGISDRNLRGEKRTGLRGFIAGELASRDTGKAKKTLVHHRWIEAWGHRIPLPAKRELIEEIILYPGH